MKLLKALIVVQFMVAVTALVLGIMLFQKREILRGRTHKLEQAFMRIGCTIEDGLTDVPARADHPCRDVSEVTAEVLAEPELSLFWDDYRTGLEEPAGQPLDLAKRRLQLMSYYKIDPITLRPARDPLTRQKITEGPGTMQGLLDDVVNMSGEQLARLNRTREQLRGTREELVDTTQELNSRKRSLRLALARGIEQDKAIAARDDQIGGLRDKIAVMEEHALALADNIGELKQTVARKDEEILTRGDEIARLEQRVAELEGRENGRYAQWRGLTPGHKGDVAAVDSDLQFVVVKLTDEFLEQYDRLSEKAKEPPEPDLMVSRKDDGAEFVTKVKLNRVYPDEGVGVASILDSWRQMDVLPGDRVYY